LFWNLKGLAVLSFVSCLLWLVFWSGINVFEYFTHLQQHKDEVKRAPEQYLPWNYLENIG